MARHCSTCECFDPDDYTPPQPSASNSWSREAAKRAAADAIAAAKLKRTAKP